MTELVVDKETGEITEPEPVDEPGEPVENDEDDDELTELEDEEALGDEQARQQALQQTAQTEREIEGKNRKLADEAKRHANRVVQIMGDEDSGILEMCPLCLPLIPGFRYPQPPNGDQLAAVKEAIGEPASPNYPKDKYSRSCDDCGGLGAVDTGSKVVGQGSARCITCQGRGWVAVGPERASGAIAPVGDAPAAVSYTPEPLDAPDSPEVAALKALGYIVVPPIPQPAP